MNELNQVIQGDALSVLKTLPDGIVQTCVTSPPYWGLRDYGVAGQLGLEKTPEEYIQKLVEIFREVKRVLKDDGTLWINLGDSYAGSGKGQTAEGCADPKVTKTHGMKLETNKLTGDLKPKDLVGIPWMAAFALRADGWYLRSDIIWAKPNPMPESVTDRPTKSHEYIFLLSKSGRYFYDAEAIKEPITQSSFERISQDVENREGSDRVPGKTNGKMKAVVFGGTKGCADNRKYSGKEWSPKQAGGGQHRNAEPTHTKNAAGDAYITRNKRDVWTITTKGFDGAHFATFPPEIPELCILAGSKPGDIVLEPFCGSGTTCAAAAKYRREFIGIELNPEYIKLANKRIDTERSQFKLAL